MRKEILSFKGIKYASANRWEYPIEENGWQPIGDVFGCQKMFSDYKASSYQMRAFVDEKTIPGKEFYYKEFREGLSFTYSEDCQYLNIWTSISDNGRLENQKMPVLVYVHGGSYTTGSSADKPFDGEKLATQDIVVVTINYRLGPLGFICLPELQKEAGHTGNYGLYDQLVALQWIKHNIEIFGGDSDNITVMGQSAGAMALSHLIVSEQTKGLFNKAVLSSGGGFSNFIAPKEPKNSYAFWKKVMEECNASNIEEFKSVEPEVLYKAWDKVSGETKGSGMIASPVVDDIIIKSTEMDDYKNGNYEHIPLIIGSNSEDIVTPVFYEMVNGWGKNMALYKGDEEERIKCYTYHFSCQLPGDEKGAWHSSDLWYWFGNFNDSWRPWEEKDEKISKNMMKYLVNFVKTSNPNDSEGADEESIVVWESSEDALGKMMHFTDNGCVMQRTSLAKTVKTMLFNRK